MLQRFLQNTSIFLGSLLLSLLFAELFLRSFYDRDLYLRQHDQPFEATVWCSPQMGRYQFNPTLGWTERANGHYFEWKDFNWTQHRINERGYRDIVDIGDNNIVILGDSYIRGSLADQNQTIPYLLDVWSEKTSFTAYAAGGWSTSQQYLAYREHELTHRAVVLLLYLGNDFDNNVNADAWMRNRPQLTLENDNLSFEPATFDSRIDKYFGFNASNRPGRQRSLREQMEGRLYLLRLWNLSMQTQTPRNYPEQEIEHQIRVTTRLLREIAELASHRSSPLYVFVLPERSEIHTKQLPLERRLYFNRLREALDAFFQRNPAITYVDLKEDLVELTRTTDTLYGIADAHLNPRGYFHVAEIIGGHLESDGLIDLTENRKFEVSNIHNPDCPEPNGDKGL